MEAPLARLGDSNRRLKYLRRLGRRREVRQETGEFLVEGPSLIGEALASAVDVRLLVVPEGQPPDQLVEPCTVAGVEVVEVSRRAFESIATTKNPQPAVAVAARPWCSSAELVGLAGPLFVLDRVTDAGNVGTLVRVAEAAGVEGIVADPAGIDLLDPKVVRASAGSLFRVPVCVEPVDDIIGRLCDAGRPVYGTAGDGGLAYDAVPIDPPPAVVLGNEAHGIRPEVRDRLDDVIGIPLGGGVESLNVAVAGAVIAFELRRRVAPSS